MAANTQNHSSIKTKHDMEDTEDTLDADDLNPVDFWEKRQKELVTSVVDYNLGAIADLVTSNAIDIAPKYQRRFRWDEEKKSKLIESFLMNVPVPQIFLNEDTYGQYSVIDGKQRISAITEFFRGKFKLKGLKVFSDINGFEFDDLPVKLQTVLKTRPTMRALIILRQSDPDLKFEVFRRLNTGGVKLNAQEIRNSTYPGPLNDMILELSEEPIFHRLLGIKNKRQSSIYQEMRDVELVLRFFTFQSNWHSFSGGMMRQLDRFMQDNQRAKEPELKKLRRIFMSTLESVEAGLGERSFQRWMPEKEMWRKQVLAALFDAQMFAFQGRDSSIIVGHQSNIIEGVKILCSDPDFRKSIDAATNTPSLFRVRITKMTEMIDRICR